MVLAQNGNTSGGESAYQTRRNGAGAAGRAGRIGNEITMRNRMLAAAALALGVSLAAADGRAAEGGFSNYFPGAFGSFLVGMPPDPGLMTGSQTLIYSADVDRAVVDGRVDTSLHAFAVYDLLSALYTPEEPVLGGRFQLGGFLPVGHVDAHFHAGGGDGRDGGDTNIGDLGLVPASLYWTFGELHLKAAELIIAPTGHYDVHQKINVGRNYWSFDSQLGLTWFHQQTGTELSLLPGIMLNTENTATDYHTGTELHLDFMLNQFLSRQLAVGVQGYFYDQLAPDSGSGAVLGGLEGQSLGIGPAFLWVPGFAEGRLNIVGKWLHDVESTHRLQGDYGQLTVAWKFQ